LERIKRETLIKRVIAYIIPLAFAVSCINPFAPKFDASSSQSGSLISDQSSVAGVFQNFQYAYTFKDSLIYGQLLDKNFTFGFRDYEQGVDVRWGRDDEMKVTYGLFQNAQSLDLVWNNIVTMSSDSTNIIRSFNLTITFNPTDIVSVTGRINFSLAKDTNAKWKITGWIDESDF
jgi:hypothetical protein